MQDLESLQNDFYGRFVVKNCKLVDFKKHPETWKAELESSVKKKQLFEDILQDGKSENKKTQPKKSGKKDQNNNNKDEDEAELDDIFAKPKQENEFDEKNDAPGKVNFNNKKRKAKSEDNKSSFNKKQRNH